MTIMNVCLPPQKVGSVCSGDVYVSENPVNLTNYANRSSYYYIIPPPPPALYALFLTQKWASIVFEWPVGFAPMNGHLFFQLAGTVHYFKKVQMLEVWGINPNPGFFCSICVSYITNFLHQNYRIDCQSVSHSKSWQKEHANPGIYR